MVEDRGGRDRIFLICDRSSCKVKRVYSGKTFDEAYRTTKVGEILIIVDKQAADQIVEASTKRRVIERAGKPKTRRLYCTCEEKEVEE